MKIVLFHPVLLPAREYGGVERVVLWLAQGLVERGHEVWVAALRGSRMPLGVKLLEVDPQRKGAQEILSSLPDGTDVVHFMAPPEAGVMEKLDCASLLTVHGNGKPGERFPKNTVFLSEDHARRHGARAFVHNGVHPSECLFSAKKGKELLFLSKTSWRVKNLRGAIRLARLAGEPLAIAGGHRPFGARMMASIRREMRWVGPVGGRAKAELLAGSKALVFPVLWPEPFGLVVIEALLSGTPVFASAIGSLPELVPPQVGMVLPMPVDSESEERWVDAIHRIPKFAPEACREWAQSRFLHSHMAGAYEALYKRIVHGESLHETEPVASGWRLG